MIRWILGAIGIAALSIAISAIATQLLEVPSAPHDPHAYELSREISLQYEHVSLVTLLANPQRYDGQKLLVSGFVTLEHEGTGLHLDRASYEAGLRKNAVWLERPKWLNPSDARRLNRRYATVAATFDASQFGHMGLFSGALTHVRKISPTYTPADHERWLLDLRREALIRQLLSGWCLTIVGWTALFMYWALARRRA